MDIFEKMQDPEYQKVLLKEAAACAGQYLDSVVSRDVYPPDKAIHDLELFDGPLPELPGDPVAVLQDLHRLGSPATVAQSGGRYFGFVNGGTLPAGLAAKWLCEAWGQNYALYVMSPVTAKLESLCEAWLVDMFGLPHGTVAGFVSGTSTATMCGLAAARHALLDRLGWNPAEKGLFDAPRLRVVLGDQAHSSVFKALAILGFGKAQTEHVPVDKEGRLRTENLPRLDDRTLVITQAGNVNSGAFDDFQAICDKAARAGSWVHVDGAFGLWAAASEKKRRLIRGMERADSWSVDAHKTLNAPYDSGIVLCRHAQALVSAMQATGSYIQYSDNRDGMLYTPEMSRRARAVELWAVLKTLGRRGVETLVDRLCERADQFAAALSQAGFRILNEVVFNQVMVACDTEAETKSVLQAVQRSGTCWCGGAMWRNEPVIRISVCSWRTTEADVRLAVDTFVKARKEKGMDR
ncbi:aspartate aminotransferase family protein [bacterium]|nr:aspartate aminotransferase family protein [bacterium]